MVVRSSIQKSLIDGDGGTIAFQSLILMGCLLVSMMLKQPAMIALTIKDGSLIQILAARLRSIPRQR